MTAPETGATIARLAELHGAYYALFLNSLSGPTRDNLARRRAQINRKAGAWGLGAQESLQTFQKLAPPRIASADDRPARDHPGSR